MSKNVKYISSTYHGAPEIKGDTWGYTVNMLRKCLVEGFNITADVESIDIMSTRHIKITFQSQPTYEVDQILKVNGTIFDNINSEYIVLAVDDTSITCEACEELLETQVGLLEQDYEPVTVRVAPLGFIEKFSDGDRSVFTTDEDEAYLYIDDEVPLRWDGAYAANYKPAIAPIVFMTDKMTDIDDYGKYVVPFDMSNPERFKEKDWLGTSSVKMTGIWNWITYGYAGTTTNSNTAAQSLIPTDWIIIGNGRLFYFIVTLKHNGNTYYQYYYYGKPNTNKETLSDLKYILKSVPFNSGSESSYTTSRYTATRSRFFLEAQSTNDSAYDTNIGKVYYGVLKVKNKSSKIHFNPTLYPGYNLDSGVSNTLSLSYPDYYTNRLYMSDYQITTDNGYIGKMSGAKFLYNANTLIHHHLKLYKYNKNGKYKKYLCIKDDFVTSTTTGTSSTPTVKKIIFISLNNEDWYNYD